MGPRTGCTSLQIAQGRRRPRCRRRPPRHPSPHGPGNRLTVPAQEQGTQQRHRREGQHADTHRRWQGRPSGPQREERPRDGDRHCPGAPRMPVSGPARHARKQRRLTTMPATPIASPVGPPATRWNPDWDRARSTRSSVVAATTTVPPAATMATGADTRGNHVRVSVDEVPTWSFWARSPRTSDRVFLMGGPRKPPTAPSVTFLASSGRHDRGGRTCHHRSPDGSHRS